MNCIYRMSSYYKQAKTDPSEVTPPLGYESTKQQQADKTKIVTRKINRIPSNRIVIDHSFMKQISTRSTPLREVERFLVISPAVQRKNYCLNGQNLEFINSLDSQSLKQLRQSFMRNASWYRSMTDIDKLHALQLCKDSLFQVKNHAISTFMLFYDSHDIEFINYLKKFINEQLIEYENEILISNPKLGRPQLKKVDYTRKEDIQDCINEIEHLGQYKNRFYSGLHLYLCDNMPKASENCSILQEETQLWDYLHFHISVITGTLDEGQNAFLKIRGTFTQKTIQYLLLLKFAFSKVYLFKWMGQNCFTNDKWVVCQGFCKEQGRYISKFILENFQKIKKERESILMVEFKAIYMNQFHSNINDFNNSSPIMKVSKEQRKLLSDYFLSCYPNSANLLSKLEKLPYPTEHFEKLKQLFQDNVPTVDTHKITKGSQAMTEKSAQTFDFDSMFSQKPIQESQLDKQKRLFDLARGDSPTRLLKINKQRGKHRREGKSKDKEYKSKH